MEDRYVRACVRCHTPLIGLTCPKGHWVLTATDDQAWAVLEVASGRIVASLVTESAEQSVRWERWFLDKYAVLPANRVGSRVAPIRDRSGSRRAVRSRRMRLFEITEHQAAVLRSMDEMAAMRPAHGLRLTGSAA